MTKDELADALEAVTAHNYVMGGGDRYRLREAAQLIRDMPEGERIEGWVTDEGVHWALGQNPPIDRYLVLKMFKSQGVKECSATLILHTRKEGENG